MKKKSVISNDDVAQRRFFSTVRFIRFSLWTPVRSVFCGWAFLLIATVALHGCAGILRGPQDNPQAREMVMDLKGRNPELSQFKGLLEIRLEAGGQPTVAGRAGWAAAAPDRLRIEWLSMLGQPLLSLAADGETISLISHTERRYRQLPQSESSLQKLIKVPVAVEDLITLMSGRPLLPDFTAAQYTSGEDGIRTIVLKDRWHNTLATLVLSRDQLQSEQLYTPQGQARYQIEWQQWQTINEVAVPGRMILTAPTGERLAISVVRFWPVASFEPSLFFLDRPVFINE